jgi:F-type H+-transporting ATPase subunit b
MLTNSFLTTALPPVDYRAQEGASSFPPFDVSSFTGQLFWLVLTFVPLYLVLSRLALPKLQQVLDNREKVISDGFSVAARASEEARQTADAYEATIAAARVTADAMASKSGEEAKQRIAAHRKQVEAELAQRLADSERQIQEASAKAIKLIPDIAKEVTGELMNFLLTETPPMQKIDQAIAMALNDRENQQSEKA